MVIAALPGCNTPANPPAAGEQGGECLAGGVCNQGLECVDNVCVLEDINSSGINTNGVNTNGEPQEVTLLIFHNNLGPMCLDALAWFDTIESDHPELVIEEHLTTEAGERTLMWDMEAEYDGSEGVSNSFGYLPIIFVADHAFSGFNDEVAAAILDLLPEAAAGTS